MSRTLRVLGAFILLTSLLLPLATGLCEFDNDALDSDFDDGDIYNHRMAEAFRATFSGTPSSFDIYDANADGKQEFIILCEGGFILVAHNGEELTHLVEDSDSIKLNKHLNEGEMSSAFGADLDGDKLPEIYVTTKRGLYIWEYDKASKTWASQGFQDDIIIDRWGTGSTGAMCRTNLDGDKADEFVIVDQESNVLVLDSVNGEVVMKNAGSVAQGGQWSTTGDIDNDGTRELLAWGGPLIIYRYEKSSQTYEPKLVTDIGAKFVACADYDKDKDHEVYTISGVNAHFDGKDYGGLGRILFDVNHDDAEWTTEIIHKDDYYTKSGALLFDNDVAAGDITNNGEAEFVAWLNQANNGALQIEYLDEEPKTDFKIYYHTFYDRQNLNYGLYVCDSDGDGRNEVVSLQRVWMASGSLLGGGSVDIEGLTNIVVTEWADPASRRGIFNTGSFLKIGAGVGVLIAIITVSAVVLTRRR